MPEADDEIRRLGETLNEMLDRLEAALERERAFVADASHELRTPLALLKTELELALRDAKTPEELRAAIASAARRSTASAQLAEDLLVLARSEQGELALHLRAGRVARAARRRAGAVRGAAPGESGRALAVQPADGLIGRRRSGSGSSRRSATWSTTPCATAAGEITLSAAVADDDLELHVSRRGPGFPPEFLDRAFERFSRADPARGGDGTGLGLAIVEAIARAHGGSADAANRDGGGADVWIELPH